MKIVKFEAENIKRLVAVEINPDGNIVSISGKNGAGKSSVLDAIFWAISGTKHIQEKPIREGEDKAFIRLELDGQARKLIIERKFTKSGTTLSVMSEDGAKYSSPQKMLDELVGAITFDPLEFSRLKGKEQYEILQGLLKLDIDLDQMAIDYQTIFDERTLLNRDTETFKVSSDSIVVPQNAPKERIDTLDLMDQIRRAAEIEINLESIKLQKQSAEDTKRDLEDRLNQANRVIAEHERSEKELEDNIKETDHQNLKKKLENANELNESFNLKQSKEEQLKKYEEARNKSEQKTKKLNDLKKEKADALEAADMPIDGLGLQNGEVVFNGIPFSQLSSAEQIKVSTAIAISMNPELRVLRIKDGSLLDDESLKIIEEMSKEKDFQFWIELVDTGNQTGIIIEDGMIKE